MAPKKRTQLTKRGHWKQSAKADERELSARQRRALSASGCLLANNEHGAYCVPKSSRRRPAARAILLGKVWEPRTIDFIVANCGKGDVVHAGTFFGDFLPALSKAVAANARVWAFEPNPENFRCARTTVEINNLTNVVLRNAGLGAEQEILFLQTSDESGRALGGASRILAKEQPCEDTRGERVQVLTVDETIGNGRTVSIIQLDVEGHEQKALVGALSTIRRCLPILIFEVLPDSTLLDSEWFGENILSLGYRKIRDVHSNAVFVSAAE